MIRSMMLIAFCLLIGCSDSRDSHSAVNPKQDKNYYYLRNDSSTSFARITKLDLLEIDGVEYIHTNHSGYTTVHGKLTLKYKDGSVITWDNGVLSGDLGNKVSVE